MTAGSTYRLRIFSAIALSVSLVSCSSAPKESTRIAEPAPSEVTAPVNSPEPSEFVLLPDPDTRLNKETPSSLAEPEPVTTPARESADASAPPVEISANQSDPKKAEKPPAKPKFQPKSPSLANLKLGSSEKDVFKLYGLPDEAYPLPGDDQTIDIWAYDGLSVGFNGKNKVVYVEIHSSKIDTGIQGLQYGMKGAQAATLLGIPDGNETNVLTLEVAGGWVKIDLDPDTRKVLSLKLLVEEI